MTDRPPLSDIDYVAACEAAQNALRALALEPDGVLDLAAVKVVDAVWPILHTAAYAAGRASILDGDRGGEA